MFGIGAAILCVATLLLSASTSSDGNPEVVTIKVFESTQTGSNPKIVTVWENGETDVHGIGKISSQGLESETKTLNNKFNELYSKGYELVNSNAYGLSGDYFAIGQTTYVFVKN